MTQEDTLRRFPLSYSFLYKVGLCFLLFSFILLCTEAVYLLIERNDENSFSELKDNQYKVVCYYTIPLNSSDLQPNAIDPYLCTHVIVGFAQLVNNTILPRKENDAKVYREVLALRNINPSLKVLLSIGEQGYDELGFLKTISNEETRKWFARKECARVTGAGGFDGLDLDWEFPAWPKADPDVRANFSQLLEEVRAAFGKGPLLLTVAVSASKNIMEVSYNIPSIARWVDFVNLMAYDYHVYSGGTPVTGPNAPLYRRPSEGGLLATLNTDWSVRGWQAWGMPAHKLVVGIPTYAHSFTLVNEDNNGWEAPASGFGSLGQAGFINYVQACLFVASPATTHLFDDDYKVPYAFRSTQWISYDNPHSVTVKANYIKENRLGGAMVYSLNSDDFSGRCGQEKFVLTRKISNVLS